MTTSPSRQLLLAGAALAALALSSPVGQVSAQQKASPPDFSSNQVRWVSANGGEFVAVPGSPAPLRQDPAHPFVGNGQGTHPTYRPAALYTPRLKQCGQKSMKK